MGEIADAALWGISHLTRPRLEQGKFWICGEELLTSPRQCPRISFQVYLFVLVFTKHVYSRAYLSSD